MSDDKPKHQGAEADAQRNKEDDFAQHGGGPKTRRENLRVTAHTDLYNNEDRKGGPRKQDDDQYIQDEIADWQKKGDADILLSTTSTARTTGTTNTLRSKEDTTSIEDLDDFEDQSGSVHSKRKRYPGNTVLSRKYNKLMDKLDQRDRKK